MSFILLEYQCTACGASLESLEKRSAPAQTIAHPPCDAEAERVISAVAGRLKRGEVTRGASAPRPANVMDTRPLAEGMPLKEFRRQRAAKRAKERYSRIKADLG